MRKDLDLQIQPRVLQSDIQKTLRTMLLKVLDPIKFAEIIIPIKGETMIKITKSILTILTLNNSNTNTTYHIIHIHFTINSLLSILIYF